MIGMTISYYRIYEKLGEGGMGVVYKAEDTKLKRTVALKFLPKGLEAHEPERARFLQEAQAASALNHPNVCTIYDIKEEGEQHFIVMEFVDGVTLKTSIVNGHLSFENCLSYAIQIAEALQEAHSHGIVHRDVKPENIMVNAKNQIKVMDFGLAKLKGSLKLTKTSSTVGTLAYMAPEHIQGGEVDARGDIFSFGIVLYEMLTGHLPFRGEHEAAMMYSILNENPEPIQKYRQDLSSELLHILNRALEKDPEERYQTVHDMLIDLRRLKKETTRVVRTDTVERSASGGSSRSGERPEGRSTIGKRKLILIGVGVILVAVALYLFLLTPHSYTINPDMTFRVLPIPFTEIGHPGLSQDGNWAVVPAADANSKRNLYFMNTTSGDSRQITFDSILSVSDPDISPDGSQVVYARYVAPIDVMEIAIVSSIGGSGKKIIDSGWVPRWRPDGERIGYLRDENLGSQSGKWEFWTIKPNGSDNHRELVDSASSQSDYFSWSPDGRSICWNRHFSQQCQELIVCNLSTGIRKQITFDNKEISDVCWAANDHIIFSSNRSGNFNLWMVSASGGSATQITKGAGPDHSMDISRDGSKLLYRQRQSIGHIWMAGTDGSNPRQITLDDAMVWKVSFSPDGNEVLFGFIKSLAYQEGLCVCSIDRNGRNRKQLTSGEESINNPLTSPDGRWIIYGSHSLSSPTDSSMVYLIDAKNPAIPRMVGKGVPIRWIDEKKFLSFDDSSQSTWLNTINGEPRKFFDDSTWAIPLQGGKYIGYGDRRSGRQGLWICAASGVKDPELPSPRMLSSVEYGEFDKSGKFFYYVKNAGELRRISIPSGKEEVIRGVFPGINPSLSWLDISYDGKEIVYTDTRFNSKLIMIENLFK